MTALEITLATLCAVLFAANLIQLFRQRRAIDDAVLEYVVALAFIAEGRAKPEERAFVVAVLTGDPKAFIPLRFPDFAAYRARLIAEHQRGA